MTADAVHLLEGTVAVTAGEQAGTSVATVEGDPAFRAEHSLRTGALVRTGSANFLEDVYIFAESFDSAPWLREEIRANGGRYDNIPGEDVYVVFSYSGDSDLPSSCATYTADGARNGYTEFEWAVIDP